MTSPHRDGHDTVPECLACGVCCFSTLERYVPVSGDDYSRLGDEADDLVIFLENKAYMRLSAGHCAALRVADPLGFACSVYERRPTVCRELARGSSACAGERSLKADRPLLALHARQGRREQLP
jgi:Fe-S-cluster containining protein